MYREKCKHHEDNLIKVYEESLFILRQINPQVIERARGGQGVHAEAVTAEKPEIASFIRPCCCPLARTGGK
jgi:hypothetical protein